MCLEGQHFSQNLASKHYIVSKYKKPVPQMQAIIISKCANVVIDFYSTHALLIFEIKMNVMPWSQSLARNCEFKMFLFVSV